MSSSSITYGMHASLWRRRQKGGFIPQYSSRLTDSLRCSLIALPIKNRQSGMARKNTPWPCWHGKLLQEFRFGASPARWYGAVRRDRDVSGAPPKAEPTEADLLLHVEMAKEDFRGKPQLTLLETRLQQSADRSRTSTGRAAKRLVSRSRAEIPRPSKTRGG